MWTVVDVDSCASMRRKVDVGLRSVAGVLLVVMTLGAVPAAAAESGTTPIPGWARPLCLPRAVPVNSPWDREVNALFTRLVEAAGDDLRGRDPVVVVVEGDDLPAAGACGGAGLPSTILLSAHMLRAADTWRPETRELIIATRIAHEIAHVTLHQERGRGLPLKRKEAEADALGAYYLERAGFDCRRWVAGIGTWYGGGYASDTEQRAIVELGCALAKRGERPDFPPR